MNVLDGETSLIEEPEKLFLGEGFLLQEVEEVSVLGEFQENVERRGSVQEVDELDDVGVFERLVQLHFSLRTFHYKVGFLLYFFHCEFRREIGSVADQLHLSEAPGSEGVSLMLLPHYDDVFN